MPFVKVEIISGKTTEYKKQLLNSIHEALVNVLDIDDDDRYQRLFELEPQDFERRAAKTDKFTFIELTILPGRSKETKGKIISEITFLLSNGLGIEPTDIVIIIHEPPLENWGCYGRQGSEMNFNYKKR